MPLRVRHSLSSSLEELLPDRLQHEDPPHPVDIANQIERVVIWNLKRTLMANVRGEHQLYGADNTYLHSCFPPRRNFSVIPQAILRRVGYVPKNTNPLKISVGSTGAEFLGRRSAVKVIPTDSDEPRQQYVCAVVEIKLSKVDIVTQEVEPQAEEYDNEGEASFESWYGIDQAGEGKGEDQGEGEGQCEDQSKDDGDGEGEDNGMQLQDMEGDQNAGDVVDDAVSVLLENMEALEGKAQMSLYMKMILKHNYRDPDLRGFLLDGNYFQRFKINGDQVVVDDPIDIFAPGDPLTMDLCNIASRHWNRDEVGGPPSPMDVDFLEALGLPVPGH
ncbi:hypothetical protein GLOTRDRAFT_94687 [Gloeophyllum trabeum ATCC 11539]|uniref:Uncharacterized protein n=1 Tax=Gloeophyllum trabeum (strain ATCC 11539 / FP-39264 / Madison 617) TaxID=670483 RepID=S7Q1M3_GLOTA|nr:uncharacterized protein GLOTRDRAFT_94687 [Gloeophyllum trabeum ATCC 11539]EPQ53427.1 hypothetical protein GLOTRDRAFT_94687 [Gloeophyllum trabeum ATCC 11539]